MFYDKKDPMIENLSIMFCHSEVVWSCICDDDGDVIDEIMCEVREQKCFGAYSNGSIKDERCPVTSMSFNGEAITASVREKAVEFFSYKFEAFLKAIYAQLKAIITELDLDCEQNSRRKNLNLFWCNEKTNKEYDDRESGISWSIPLRSDSDEKSYIPIRLLKNGAVSYVNFALVNKNDLSSKVDELSNGSPINSEIFSDFLTLITEDAELLSGDYRFHREYGYIKTILIGIDPDDPSKSVVIDAHTVEGKEMHSLMRIRQQDLIDELLGKIKQQYLGEFSLGYVF